MTCAGVILEEDPAVVRRVVEASNRFVRFADVLSPSPGLACDGSDRTRSCVVSLTAPITNSQTRRPPVTTVPAVGTLRRALLIGAVAALVKLALAAPFLSRYGWDRDELYFLQASRHLSLGYVDFPLMTALIGRLTIDLAGPSLAALRLTGVIAGMATVVLVALCARELGGGVRAQALAAGAFVVTPYCLGIGAIFHPTMFDVLSWVAFSYVALRILRRPEPSRWPLLGVIAALGLETKTTIAALIGVFVVALLVLGPRGLLRDRRVWLGAAIAFAGMVPYLVWEATHGWPSLTFLPSQDAATAASVSRPGYIAQQVAFLGGTVVLVVAGVRELWRDPRLRALAVLAPATSLLFLAEQGRSYYSLPAIVLPLAAGAVAADRWLRSARRPAMAIALLVAAQIAALVLAAPLVWPILPTGTMVASGEWNATFYKDELGWPQLARQTARAWRSLPAEQRTQTTLLAANYGEAGALDLYGPADGLPQALSGHLSFQYWRPRRLPDRHALLIGFDTASVRDLCITSRRLATIDNRWHIANEERGRTIVSCGLRAPLGQLWATYIARDTL
jgi:4-amino-4-deoxy-L-arabinose transferase-like glycosyltransferase